MKVKAEPGGTEHRGIIVIAETKEEGALLINLWVNKACAVVLYRTVGEGQIIIAPTERLEVKNENIIRA